MSLCPLQRKVSVAAGVKASKLTVDTLDSILDQIGGDQYRLWVESVREAAANGNEGAIRKGKLRLPAFTPSGTFSQRKADKLKQHSGLICLDVDKVQDLDQVRETVQANPYTLAAFVSPSGNGLKIMVRVDGATGETHKAYFQSLRQYYRDQLGIEVDTTCADVSRLCFFSHDPALFRNPSAQVWVCNTDYTDNTDHTDHIDHTSNKESVCVTPSPQQATLTPEEVIAKTLPTDIGQRHKLVFKLTRGLKIDAGLGAQGLSAARPYVLEWHRLASPFIATKEFMETWADFCHAWPRVRSGITGNPVDLAWASVTEEELPKVCNLQPDPPTAAGQRLLALCWHLKDDDGRFFLSSHIAGGLIEKKPTQVMRYMRGFVGMQLLKIVKIGDRHKASIYRWCDPLPEIPPEPTYQPERSAAA